MRKTLSAVVVAGLAAVALILGVAAGTQASGAAQDSAAAPSAVTPAYEYMAALSDEIGARTAGLSPESRAADRILAWFSEMGYTPDEQEFRYTIGDRQRRSRNIVAVKPGAGGEQIVIGAHYDSSREGRGAFDNASGVALLLQLAASLRNETTPYTLVFVAFGSEEVGLRGSTHYVSEMSPQARADTVLMINLDSVATGDRVYCYSSREAPWPQLAFRSIARGLGIHFLTSPGLNKQYAYGTTGDWSDHAAFRRAGIPYLYIEATNWLIGDKSGYQNTVKDGQIWHTSKDTLSFIQQRYPGRLERQLNDELAALIAFLTTYRVPESASAESAAPAADGTSAEGAEVDGAAAGEAAEPPASIPASPLSATPTP